MKEKFLRAYSYLNYAAPVFALAALAAFAALWFARSKVAYIDTDVLLAADKEAAGLQKEIDKAMSPYQKEANELLIEIQYQRNRYEKEAGSISAAQSAVIQRDFDNARKKLTEVQQSAQEMNSRLRAQYFAPVYLRINESLRRFGKAKGYKLIFAVPPGNYIAYAEEGSDVTADAIEWIEKNFETALPKSQINPAEK